MNSKIPIFDNCDQNFRNRHYSHDKTLPEVFTAGGTKLIVVSDVVVDTSLGQHSVVLDLRFPEKKKR